MDPRYHAWIQHYVAEHKGFVRGRCTKATVEMVEAFPELVRVCGFVYCSWGRDQHWWCIDPDGVIVDPTASQFHGAIEYEPIDLSRPDIADIIPTGRCPNCGTDCYRHESVCSDECAEDYARYLNEAMT